MNVFEPEHGLGREYWGIPESRWRRALSWRGQIQLVLPLLSWVGAAAIGIAWLATEPLSWGHFALAVLLLTLACAVSVRAAFFACRPDILICEAGLLLGRTAKCRRELRWEGSFTCSWRPSRPQQLVVRTPHEILEYKIPADCCERLSAELRRRGKWAEATG